MNYDHAYHAGNPADVVKHAALALVLRELTGKTDPVHYLETHAGAGSFSLSDPTGEWTQGIAKILSKSAQRRLPELATYLGLVGGEPEGPLEYPGSPAIAAAILREQDRLDLYELNPRDHATLKQRLDVRKDRRIHVHVEDGYGGLARVKPAPGARLAVLVDPPFEDVDEWNMIRDVFVRTAERHPSAALMLWYPLKAGPPHEGRPEQLRIALEKKGVRGVALDLRLRGGLLLPRTEVPKVRGALTGTGMIFAGVPGRALARIAAAMPELSRSLARPEHGRGWEASLVGWG